MTDLEEIVERLSERVAYLELQFSRAIILIKSMSKLIDFEEERNKNDIRNR